MHLIIIDKAKRSIFDQSKITAQQAVIYNHTANIVIWGFCPYIKTLIIFHTIAFYQMRLTPMLTRLPNKHTDKYINMLAILINLDIIGSIDKYMEVLKNGKRKYLS